ncbi:hypothetical protein CCC_02300 [Paramagnetospirillum magnetotacticum MS-1]|uniref:Uncharacterized protein n=1 Tax=Paramagnetospirillum magnetotacticum MS-1 TaxID=272627 RepID=A0A0C2YVW1_PARME|nr:hypothetical protein [Paramagnetospirillum magnetotacticum]KIL98850.1 hypothetical protein CCC_02300 [Paramagnetospirillum magnetotacticum MS-1]
MSATHRLIRTITLSLAPNAPATIVETLARPEGILDLKLLGPFAIMITYDLRHATLADMERWLAANGVNLSTGLFARLRRLWLAFKDENRRDQNSIVHQCCSVPPAKE